MPINYNADEENPLAYLDELDDFALLDGLQKGTLKPADLSEHVRGAAVLQLIRMSRSLALNAKTDILERQKAYLAATLEESSIEEVLLRLYMESASGFLMLKHGTKTKVIAIGHGVPHTANSNIPEELLTRFLVREGYVDEARVHALQKMAREEKLFLGWVILREGAMKTHELIKVLRQQSLERVAEAFSWTQGKITFFEDDRPNKVRSVIDGTFFDVMRAGAVWQRANEDQLFEHLRARLIVNKKYYRIEPELEAVVDQLNGIEIDILALMSSGMRSGQILSEFDLGMAHVYDQVLQTFYLLIRQGLVTLVDEPSTLPIPASLEAAMHPETEEEKQFDSEISKASAQADKAEKETIEEKQEPDIEVGESFHLGRLALVWSMVFVAVGGLIFLGPRYAQGEYLYLFNIPFCSLRRGILLIAGLVGLYLLEGTDFAGLVKGLGWRFPFIGCFLAALIGAGAGFMWPQHGLFEVFDASVWLMPLGVLVDEFFFRVFLTRLIQVQINKSIPAVLFSSILWGFYHLSYWPFAASPFWSQYYWVSMMIVLSGIPLAFLSLRYKSIWPSFVCHLSGNIIAVSKHLI